MTIKWPNDIYVEDKKIAGVLIENGIKGTYLSHSIVGIGINVNQTQFSDPQRTTSLKEMSVSSEDYDIPTIVKELYKALNQEYLLLKANKKTEQLKTYNKQLFRRGKLKPFILNDKTIEATIIQVLEKFEHEVLYFYAGQVANAKSLINLLAINICNMPQGYFEINDNEMPSKIDEIKSLLEKIKREI